MYIRISLKDPFYIIGDVVVSGYRESPYSYRWYWNIKKMWLNLFMWFSAEKWRLFTE